MNQGNMCGRVRIAMDKETLISFFGIETWMAERFIPPNVNCAPTDLLWAIRKRKDGKRELVQLRWGLVPRWAKDVKVGQRAFNARVETVHERPMFRDAVRYRRCLIPVSGFYEWQKSGNSKQPFLIATEEEMFTLAGLWESWVSPDGEVIESCTVMTTVAPAQIDWLHSRAPVVIPVGLHASWLDPALKDISSLRELLSQCMIRSPFVTRQVDRMTLM